LFTRADLGLACARKRHGSRRGLKNVLAPESWEKTIDVAAKKNGSGLRSVLRGGGEGGAVEQTLSRPPMPPVGRGSGLKKNYRGWKCQKLGDEKVVKADIQRNGSQLRPAGKGRRRVDEAAKVGGTEATDKVRLPGSRALWGSRRDEVEKEGTGKRDKDALGGRIAAQRGASFGGP